MKRFTRPTITRQALAALAAGSLLALAACGSAPDPAPAPAAPAVVQAAPTPAPAKAKPAKAKDQAVPAAVAYIQDNYADTVWVDSVTGATLAAGTLTIHTDYPDATDPDARDLAKAICTAGKMYVMTRGNDDMDGSVAVRAADDLVLGRC